MKRIIEKIHNKIFKFVIKHFGYEIVHKWIFFTFNYPYKSEKDFQEMFKGKIIGSHLFNKFAHSSDMGRWWCDMSTNYRIVVFEEWFLRDYVFKSKKK